MAPGIGIEPILAESKSVVLPLHYPGLKFVGGNGKSRTFTGHRMKVLHYRYATLP